MSFYAAMLPEAGNPEASADAFAHRMASDNRASNRIMTHPMLMLTSIVFASGLDKLAHAMLSSLRSSHEKGCAVFFQLWEPAQDKQARCKAAAQESRRLSGADMSECQRTGGCHKLH